jgi:hypothetical protein
MLSIDKVDPVDMMTCLADVKDGELRVVLENLFLAKAFGSPTQAKIFLSLYYAGGKEILAYDLAKGVFDFPVADPVATLRVHIHHLRSRILEARWPVRVLAEKTEQGGAYRLEVDD